MAADINDLETRLAAIEARLATPLAAALPISIGELTDVPAPGSPIKSAWAQEVSARVVQQFATLADRNAKWPNPAPGAVAIITSADNNAGIWEYSRGAWQRPWGTAWGSVGVNSTPTAVNGISAIVDIPGLAINPIMRAGRQYIIHYRLGFFAVGAGVCDCLLTGPGADLVNTNATLVVNQFWTAIGFALVAGGPGIQQTYKVRARMSANTVNTSVSATNPGLIAAYDIGPIN